MSVRLEYIERVDAIASTLSSDFVVPYVGCTDLHRPNDEDMFLGRLQSSPVRDRVLQQVEQNRAVQQEIDAMTTRSRSMVASVRRIGCQESRDPRCSSLSTTDNGDGFSVNLLFGLRPRSMNVLPYFYSE